eukprot:IDg5167t1
MPRVTSILCSFRMANTHRSRGHRHPRRSHGVLDSSSVGDSDSQPPRIPLKSPALKCKGAHESDGRTHSFWCTSLEQSGALDSNASTQFLLCPSAYSSRTMYGSGKSMVERVVRRFRE